MQKPLGVLEDIDHAPRKRLFTLWGVDWVATPYWWLFPLLMIAGMLPLVQAQFPRRSWAARLGISTSYGLLLYLTNTLHSLGHMLSAQAVHAPMQQNLLSATRCVNLYNDPAPEALPSRVHVGRAAGGPLINTALGILLALFGNLQNPYIQHLMRCNLAFGLGALLPLRSLDGEILLRELRREA